MDLSIAKCNFLGPILAQCMPICLDMPQAAKQIFYTEHQYSSTVTWETRLLEERHNEGEKK